MKKPAPPERSGVGLITCSCGARLRLDQVEKHATQHGLEGDTYVAAQLREWLRELSETTDTER